MTQHTFKFKRGDPVNLPETDRQYWFVRSVKGNPDMAIIRSAPRNMVGSFTQIARKSELSLNVGMMTIPF